MSTAPVPESKQADSAAPKKAKHITDLTIENFRGLRKVELHGLGAVNLIVGQNNTGKTSLLEAIMAVVKPEAIKAFPEPFRQSTSKNSPSTPPSLDEWLLSEGTTAARVVVNVSAGSLGGEVRLMKAHAPKDWVEPKKAPEIVFEVGRFGVEFFRRG